MNLQEVHCNVQTNKSRKRIGRGPGSGHGKTAGRGHKGQGSRSGSSSKRGFEGGQMPMMRRIPKRGFHNQFAETVAIVNLADLERCFESGQEVTIEALQAKQLAKGRFDQLKVLGDGALTKKLKIAAHKFSKSALEKIAQAGGEAVVLPGKAPVVKNKMKVKPSN
ncbi:MAG: 50S ribosomal protein L15 [Pirellulales bacterium]|nr:50S ribosomal protein L15 [Pirellulales bacterium]